MRAVEKQIKHRQRPIQVLGAVPPRSYHPANQRQAQSPADDHVVEKWVDKAIAQQRFARVWTGSHSTQASCVRKGGAGSHNSERLTGPMYHFGATEFQGQWHLRRISNDE